MPNSTTRCRTQLEFGRGFCRHLLFYGASLAITLEVIVLLVQNGHANSLFLENGPLEWCQFLLAFSAGIWLIHQGQKGRPVLVLCGLLALFAGGRELDGLFDNLVFHGSHKFLFAPPIALALVWIVCRHRKTLRNDTWRFTGTPAFCLLAAGFLLVCVFAQIFGQKEFWMGLMEENYLRLVKNAAEETSELAGYLFLFFGAVEASWRFPWEGESEVAHSDASTAGVRVEDRNKRAA